MHRDCRPLGGLAEHVVAWRERFAEEGVAKARAGATGPGTQAQYHVREDRRDRPVDARGEAGGRNALELAVDGQSRRGEPGDGAADLVGSRPRDRVARSSGAALLHRRHVELNRDGQQVGVRGVGEFGSVGFDKFEPVPACLAFCRGVVAACGDDTFCD